MNITKNRSKFDSLQILRGIAATMIVVGHVFSHNLGFSAQPFIWMFSRIYVSGVDIFFSICGFIILYSIKNQIFNFKTSLIFIIRRLLRIYPVYWVVFFLSIIIAQIVNLNHDNQTPHSFSELFFLTTTDNYYNPPGWSLPLEIYFYLGVFLITFLFKRHYEIVVFGWLFIKLLIAIKYTSVEIMTNALLVEFMFGVLLYFAHKYNFRITSFDFIISFILSIFFFFLGFKLAKDGPLAGWARVFTYGFGGMFFTYTFILIDKFKISYPKLLLVLGDASYSIYISHHLFMKTIFYLCDSNNLWGYIPQKQQFIGVIFVVIMSIGLGILIHYILEKPILLLSKNFYLKYSTS